MKKFIKLYFFLGAQLLLSPFSLQAWEDTPNCFKYLERRFYDERTLTQALSFHYIPQSEWNAIYRDLQTKMNHMPEILRKKARTMDVNPLENPFQPMEAQKLLLDTLYQALVEVMWYHNIYNNDTIDNVFKFVLKKQQDRLNDCFAVPPEFQ